MSLTVCPAAIVLAPVELVWELLDNPRQLDQWAGGKVQWVESEGPMTPGQRFSVKSKALGRSWDALFTVKEVDRDKHVLQMNVAFPLGMTLHQRLMTTPINATSCRLQYG